MSNQTVDAAASRPFHHSGRHIVLASGGAGQLFSHTTNPSVATGDGLALAYRAGAKLTDIEFYQFHPTALAIPGFPSFLISEAVRGEGAYLRNAAGERFMLRVDPRGELAPRDVVAKAISSELQREGSTHVLLDLSHLPGETVISRFRTIYAFCAKAGLDMTVDPLPVAPAAHYLMGGVQTNLWGESSLPGLYACGEVACTGVHGANRLASNSLLEGLVFGARIVERTIRSSMGDALPVDADSVTISEAAPGQENRPAVGLPSLAGLQDLMWNQVGLTRDEAGLTAARTELEAWESYSSEPVTVAEHELSNMTSIGRLMMTAALARRESRGSHYRSDFPDTDPGWRKHIVLSKAPAARYAKEVK